MGLVSWLHHSRTTTASSTRLACTGLGHMANIFRSFNIGALNAGRVLTAWVRGRTRGYIRWQGLTRLWMNVLIF